MKLSPPKVSVVLIDVKNLIAVTSLLTRASYYCLGDARSLIGCVSHLVWKRVVTFELFIFLLTHVSKQVSHFVVVTLECIVCCETAGQT